MHRPETNVVIRSISAADLRREPLPGQVLVRLREPLAHTSLALAVREHGAAMLAVGAGPHEEVLVGPSPSLDDLSAALLLARGGGAGLPLLLCEYAAQLREGLLPGTLPPERSLGGVYLAMMELYRDRPEVLIERGSLLLLSAADALARGRSLLRDDLFWPDDRFAREHAYLLSDRARYLRDVEGATQLSGSVSGLPIHILYLHGPRSILFRMFAHRDPRAPSGDGFDVVIAERQNLESGTRHVALFADPTRRLPLRDVLVPLCADLSRREAACAGKEGWYDGALHGHQRLASPRAGSRLPLAQIEQIIGAALGAAPASRSRARSASAPLVGALRQAASALLLSLCLGSSARDQDGGASKALARGDWQEHRLPSGREISEDEKEWLLSRPPRSYAILVAASEYPPRSAGGLGALMTPWRDACLLREILTRRFGYRPGDIVFLSDSPCARDAQGPPTRQQILWTIEHMPVRPEDTLLFYYAGHGAIEEEPGGRYGYLQPSGWERRDLSREDRGLRMRVLAELLRDKVAARHQLLLIDACHSGETAVVRGDDADLGSRLDARVHAGWQSRPVYAVITAAGRDDLALEERLVDAAYPHSLFMRALWEGLSYAPAHRSAGAPCRLRADVDPRSAPDGLVTDGEIFKYLARRVPELRAAITVPGLSPSAQRQVPEWNPWAAAPRGQEQHIGEFMLIPRSPGDMRCDGTPEPEPAACRCE